MREPSATSPGAEPGPRRGPGVRAGLSRIFTATSRPSTRSTRLVDARDPAAVELPQQLVAVARDGAVGDGVLPRACQRATPRRGRGRGARRARARSSAEDPRQLAVDVLAGTLVGRGFCASGASARGNAWSARGPRTCSTTPCTSRCSISCSTFRGETTGSVGSTRRLRSASRSDVLDRELAVLPAEDPVGHVVRAEAACGPRRSGSRARRRPSRRGSCPRIRWSGRVELDARQSGRVERQHRAAARLPADERVQLHQHQPWDPARLEDGGSPARARTTRPSGPPGARNENASRSASGASHMHGT